MIRQDSVKRLAMSTPTLTFEIICMKSYTTRRFTILRNDSDSVKDLMNGRVSCHTSCNGAMKLRKYEEERFKRIYSKILKNLWIMKSLFFGMYINKNKLRWPSSGRWFNLILQRSDVFKVLNMIFNGLTIFCYFVDLMIFDILFDNWRYISW